MASAESSGPISGPVSSTALMLKGLLDVPEEVLIRHVFPQLGHNDLLLLRRVCKTTNDFVNVYLWTPKKGNQGQWTLEIKPNSDNNLKSFLQKKLPPPSRLFINLEEWPETLNFFEDSNLSEFIRVYSEYVTQLKITRLDIPIMNPKEIRFYESLVRLEHLQCDTIIAKKGYRFQQILEAEGIPSTFRKLKSFQFDDNSCGVSTFTFVREMKCLEALGVGANVSMPFLRSLIEDNVDCKLKTIHGENFYLMDLDMGEVLRLLALLSDKGIKIKGLAALMVQFLLLCNENNEYDDVQVLDEQTGEQVYRVNYQRNAFVGNVIYSLVDLKEAVFLIELPHLEELFVRQTSICQFRLWQRHGDPQWPSLRKMEITVDDASGETTNLLNFLCGRIERPKLEELALRYAARDGNMDLELPLPEPLNMVRVLGNLKKLTVENCNGDSTFFATLWEGLPLLERVELIGCRNLGDTGFSGNYGMGTEPVFLKLQNLKHLSIGGVHEMPQLTNRVFREVFNRMNLESLTLSGPRSDQNPSVTVKGINALLTGNFAKSIEKLDFEELYLDGLSEDRRKELKSCFRSSKML